MHKFKNIITKVIGTALATVLIIGGITVMAAQGGNIECGSTTKVNIGKTNDTISTDYIFVPERTGTYHLESSDIVLTGYGIIDPMVRIGTGTTYSSANEICRIDGGVEGTLDFAGDVELEAGQTYTFRVSSHFNPNLRPTGSFNFTLSAVDLEDEDTPDLNPAYQFATPAEYMSLADNLRIVDMYMAQYQMLLTEEELNECTAIMCLARDAIYTTGLTSLDIEAINGRLYGIIVCIDLHREAPDDVAPDYGIPEITPEQTPDVDPDGGNQTPEVTPEDEDEAPDDVAPDYGIPEITPEQTPDVDPDGGDQTPEVTPEDEDETPDDVAPDYGIPEVTPEQTPDVNPDGGDQTPDVIPDSDDAAPSDDDEAPVVSQTPSVSSAPAASPAPSASPVPVTMVAAAARPGVDGFVNRLYEDALNRNADAVGRLYWINLLSSKAKSGTEVANGFLNSVEFISRDLDNEEFLNTLYTVFFDRKPDGEGFRNWMIALENGTTRSEVISGFTHSAEWNNTCAQFGINA